MKPMLACSTIPALEDIKYPVLASPKLDGIRCLIVDGKPLSRNLKPIPNKFIQRELTGLPELDGELMLKGGDFNSVQSAIMSAEGKPDFIYMVFDSFKYPDRPYNKRLHNLYTYKHIITNRVMHIQNLHIDSPSGMSIAYNNWLSRGYEGAIVRDPYGPYKFGRSTKKQGWMLKLKNFNDAEAVIIGYEELLRNENEPELNELGYQVRTSHKENKVGSGTLGALAVRFNNTEFKIGSGFDEMTRQLLWNRRDDLVGKKVTFKYQELSKYGVPRFPIFKGIRHENDNS